MTVVAAIDCGTNTIKLLLGDPAGDPDGVVRESRMVRLGQGVDATGRLAPEALERTFAAIDDYAALIREAGAARLRFCATSATRDAENSPEFAAGVRERLGIEPEVLSGEEEARLAFAGAVRGLAQVREVHGPALVVDIGGGSTELIVGDPATGPTAAHSMDIGSVRLHERHVRHDPPTAAEVGAIVADVDAALDGCRVDWAAPADFLGVAGTITTVAAGVNGHDRYDRARIHGSVIGQQGLGPYVERLVAMTVAERRTLPYVHPGRADVIDAGALILARIVERRGGPGGTALMQVAETDILDGIAWSLVD